MGTEGSDERREVVSSGDFGLPSQTSIQPTTYTTINEKSSMSQVDRRTFLDQLWSRRGMDSAIDCD